jgi:RNA polymerase sigma-70 factor (ECF subfamily)
MSSDIGSIYLKYGPMVFRRCLSILRQREEADDATQDVFVKYMADPGRGKVRYPSAYLYRCATNHALNLLKRRSFASADGDLAVRIAVSEDFDDAIAVRTFLDALFRREPVSTRFIAYLRYVDDMDWKEIAAMTGLSVSGVRRRLAGLRDKARRLEEA